MSKNFPKSFSLYRDISVETDLSDYITNKI